MGNDLQTERFRKLLGELGEQRDREPTEPSGPFTPLNSALQSRLLAISLGPQTARLPWHRRLVHWVRATFSRRVWLPVLLVPTTAALLIIQLTQGRVPPPQYASSVVAERKLRSGKTEMSRSADGHTLLGDTAAGMKERTELRIKRRDMLNLVLPAVPGEKGQLAVQAFVRRDSVLRTWNVQPEHQPDGSFLLLIPVRILPDLAADQELLFVYGRPEALPSLAELRAGKSPTDRRWHLQSLRLLIED